MMSTSNSAPAPSTSARSTTRPSSTAAPKQSPATPGVIIDSSASATPSPPATPTPPSTTRCASSGPSEYPSWSRCGFSPLAIIADEGVGHDDELPHDGRQGELGWFSCPEETLVC